MTDPNTAPPSLTLRVQGTSKLAFGATTAALITLASGGTALVVAHGTSVRPSSPTALPHGTLFTDGAVGGGAVVVDRVPGTYGVPHAATRPLAKLDATEAALKAALAQRPPPGRRTLVAPLVLLPAPPSTTPGPGVTPPVGPIVVPTVGPIVVPPVSLPLDPPTIPPLHVPHVPGPTTGPGTGPTTGPGTGPTTGPVTGPTQPPGPDPSTRPTSSDGEHDGDGEAGKGEAKGHGHAKGHAKGHGRAHEAHQVSHLRDDHASPGRGRHSRAGRHAR